MQILLIIPFVSLLFATKSVAATTRNGDKNSFFSNFEDILKGKSIMNTDTCDSVFYDNFELLLYTRKNPMDPIYVDMAFPELDPSKKLVIIAHGWLGSSTGYGMPNLKQAYLDRYDANVIMINWETIALDYYTTSVCKVPKVARFIADFLCTLTRKYYIDLTDVHLVGHSLGAHMSGVVGQYTKQMCNSAIGRITGLDPSGPLFVDTPRSQRLDSTDANFVEVIHTNGGFLGYYGNCGHADFYINCGSIQLGCMVPDASLKSIINLPLAMGMCHHMRSLDVWAEAVQTDNFKAIPCYYCPLGCPPVLSFFKNKIVMGEKCPKNARGGYYVKTDFKAPFALTTLI